MYIKKIYIVVSSASYFVITFLKQNIACKENIEVHVLFEAGMFRVLTYTACSFSFLDTFKFIIGPFLCIV